MSGYRGIQPVLTFEDEVHPLNRAQFVWYEANDGVYRSLFAGKEMAIYLNDDGKTFQLSYLDMAHPTSFKSPNEAKEAAPDFARAVLLHMLEVVGVRHDDRSLQSCLMAGGR